LASDVQLGTVPDGGSGWQLNTEVNAQTGLIGIELYSTTPIQSTGGGSLVTIAMHPRANASAGTPGLAEVSPLTILPFVDPAGGPRAFQTQVADSQGTFVLHVADGEKEAADTSDPDGMGRSSLVQTVISSTVADNTSVLPSAVLEEVFGNLGRTGPVQDNSFLQPAALVSLEFGNQTPSDVSDPVLQQAPTHPALSGWLSEDLLAYQEQTPEEGVDVDSLEAFLSLAPAKSASKNWFQI
jgi:hypothetical protein